MSYREEIEPWNPYPNIWRSDWAATLFAFGAICEAWDLWTAITRPASRTPFAPAADLRWIERLVGMIAAITIVCACIAYRRRRTREFAAGVDPKVAEPWPARRELRVSLYALAIQSWIPSAVVVAASIVRAEIGQWSIFIRFAFATGFALAIIAHDRRRMTHATRLAEGRCLSCGYDLRASTSCCPECGTLPAH